MPVLRGGREARPRRETVYGEVYDPAADVEPLPEPPAKNQEQLAVIRKRIESTAFLKELDEKRLTAALRHMTPMQLKAGEILFKQGDPADDFYILEEGTIEVFHKDNEADEGIGSSTGDYNANNNPCISELALLYRDERENTLKASTDCKLWKLGRPLYTRVVVKMAYERRRRHMEYLKAVPILITLENYERVRLCDAIHVKKYKEGDAIMKEGDEANGIFFVEEGEVEVKSNTEPSKICKKGDYFGDMALLTKDPRKSTATAKTECEVAFLDAGAFERLLGKLKVLLKRQPEEFKKICKDKLGTENPDENQFR